jgi:hypothetical protein
MQANDSTSVRKNSEPKKPSSGVKAHSEGKATDRLSAKAPESKSASPAAKDHASVETGRSSGSSKLLPALGQNFASKDGEVSKSKSTNSYRQPKTEETSCKVEKPVTAAEQHKAKWNTTSDIRENLSKNPDLSTYSPAQLVAVNELSKSDPKLRDQLQQTTSSYVTKNLKDFDSIPKEREFQKLLYDQVTNPQNIDPKNQSEATKKSVENAQNQLKESLKNKIQDSAVKSLDGKSGDDDVKNALGDFAEKGIKELAQRNPALVPYFEDQAKAAFDSSKLKDKAKDVAEKDDNFLTKGLNWVGDHVQDLTDKLTSIPSIGELGLDAVGLDGAADFLHNVNGGAGRSVSSVVTGLTDLGASLSEHPIETAKGLADLGLNFGALAPLNDIKQVVVDGKTPEEVLQHKKDLAGGIWDGVTSGYKETSEKYGTEGAAAHVVGDILLAVASGGTSAEASGGLKAASGLSKLADLKFIAEAKAFAVTGKTGAVLDAAKGASELNSLAHFDDLLSPALKGVLETTIKNSEKAAVQDAPTEDNPDIKYPGNRF